MKTAVITLSDKGAVLAKALSESLEDATVYLHKDVTLAMEAERFERVVALTDEIFDKYDGLVYIMPVGVVTRAIAPKIESKLTDAAVIAVDVAGRWAVSLLSGHEGGANELAVEVGNIVGAEPVISTTTEAEKNYIVGVGCKRGTQEERITEAITSALQTAGITIDDVRLIASADVKNDEKGLIAAAAKLNIPLRFIGSQEIRNTRRDFTCSKFVQEKVNLPAVAEPAALLAGVRTQIILPKTKYNGITVAIARESCMWSE